MWTDWCSGALRGKAQAAPIESSGSVSMRSTARRTSCAGQASACQDLAVDGLSRLQPRPEQCSGAAPTGARGLRRLTQVPRDAVAHRLSFHTSAAVGRARATGGITDTAEPRRDSPGRRALELDPESADSHLYYGNFLATRGPSDEAVQQFRIALQSNPLSPDINSHLGMELVALGDLDAAQRAFDVAIVHVALEGRAPNPATGGPSLGRPEDCQPGRPRSYCTASPTMKFVPLKAVTSRRVAPLTHSKSVTVARPW